MSLSIDQLTLRIGSTLVCKSLSIDFKPDEMWAILGVNGVGKSTLLHHMINIDSACAAHIVIDDIPLLNYRHQRKKLAKKAGILLQEYEYNFPCSVFEATLIGRHPYQSQWQWETDEDIKIAEQALRKTELLEFKQRMVDTLSGGEKRRLNLATLLTQDPDYFLLDEPTNHLDLHAQIKIMELLKHHIQKQHKTGIIVIHDANLAYRYCDKVLMLFGEGKWQSGSTKEMINTHNLERLYGCPIDVLSNENQTVFTPSL